MAFTQAFGQELSEYLIYGFFISPFLVSCVLAVKHKSFSVRVTSQKEKKACIRELKFLGTGTSAFWC